jgi:ferredoxin
MEGKLQRQIAFYLTGRAGRSNLQPVDFRYRPALFARHADLTSLRYDFPLVLNGTGSPERAVVSLSRLVDEAVKDMVEGAERDRVARHGHRIEQELRRKLVTEGAGDFATVWHMTADQLAGEGDESIRDSAMKLWKTFDAEGDLVDADAALPARAVRALWKAVEQKKATVFRQKAARLLQKLRDILAAETIGSAAGRAPDRLRASVGSSFANAFDFETMSTILIKSKPGAELSDERRRRLQKLIEVIERQRFYPLGDGEPYAFAFDHCSDALRAYNERHDEAVELLKTLAIAELEVSGDYRESVHDLLFEGFGANGLDAGELAGLPEYLICANANTMDAAETAQIVEILAAGLPAKVLVQTDDVLEPSPVAEIHVTLGLRARQLVTTAIGLTDVFVIQTSASQLFRRRESFLRGLTYDGPALFSVFSGANDHLGDFPPYLAAAAATESRVFPTLVYDPSAGLDWTSRLKLDGNPKPFEEWAIHTLSYEDGDLQAHSEKLAFTIADFMAMDERFFGHYAVIPKDDWSDSMIPLPEFLKLEFNGITDKVPYITLIDDDACLQRAILDHRTALEVSRCRTMWRSLQQLGGARKSDTGKMDEPENAEHAAPVSEKAVEAVAPAASAGVPVAEPIMEENGGEPYIETARCTSCNECTRINSKMFAYNENKQAYIADSGAGTFRQLVEAAEGCQVGIIHPGKPKNPKEPGLDDLIKRAAEFN